MLKKFTDSVKMFVQGAFVSSLNFSNSDYNITLELVPVIPVWNQRKDSVLFNNETHCCLVKDTLNIEQFVVNGNYVFPSDVSLMFKFKNIGTKSAYFNVIDIQPDGKIMALLPDNKKILPADCVLNPGEEKLYSNFIIKNFGPPYGLETFKIFTDKQPLDLTALVTSEGSNSKGVQGIVSILAPTYGTKGSGRVDAANSELGSASNLYLTVKQK